MFFNYFLTIIFFLSITAAVLTDKVIDVCNGPNNSLNVSLNNVQAHLQPNKDQNIVLNFCSGDSNLSSHLEFSNRNEVQLVGSTISKSVVTCHNSSAGISFRNVCHVTLLRVVMRNCGQEYTVNQNTFSASILIQNHMMRLRGTILMSNSSILNSHGVAMVVLLNQSSTVIDIANSTFKNGSAPSNMTCGGAGLFLYLECFKRAKCWEYNSTTNIVNSQFLNNSVTSNSSTKCRYFRLYNGAGVSYLLKGNMYKNVLNIQNTVFESNSAEWGGGFNALINRWSSNNSINVQNCSFKGNTGFGGGGVNIAYWFKSFSDIPCHNNIVFKDVKFLDNFAKGGAGAVFSSTLAQSHMIETNRAVFDHCLWKGNKARYSSAIYLNLQNQGTYNSRGLLPTVTFKDCHFRDNVAINHEKVGKKTVNGYVAMRLPIYKRGKGCLLSIGYKITFNASVQFVNNSGSALYLASSNVEIQSKSHVSFVGNSGFYGGAVCLFGSSIIHTHKNVNLEFVNNTASKRGGAIYQEHEDTLEYISLKKCFLHYFNPNFRNMTVSCIFQNNHVVETGTSSLSLLDGHSIYMHSLKSCESLINFASPVKNEETGDTEYLGPIAHFVFKNSTGNEISTPGTKFKVTAKINNTFPMVPGQITDLPIVVIDDFKRSVFRVYEAMLKVDSSNSENMSLDSSYTHIYYNKMLLYGTPGDKGNITFSLSSIADEELVLPITLLDCPPGFILVTESSSGLTSCICSLDTHQHNFGISSCNLTTFQAVLKSGYWLGCRIAHLTQCKDYLVSDLCPRNFCSKEELMILPKTSSIRELDRVICGTERSGVLCGKCRENYSAFYHSENLRCMSNSRCSLGPLIYLTSEILPVTIFFMFITIWDVQFTTGSLQGFILYSQLFSTLLIAANGHLPLKASTDTLLFVLQLFLNVFNLDFFVHDRLSFCLWEDASSLDILTFKYVTVVYTFSLVLLTIILLSFCKLQVVETVLKKIRGGNKQPLKISTSIIHGLSGFLVICYFQCTKISLLILTPANIRSTDSANVRQVAFYDGELTFLRNRHLYHAIPAILVIATLVILPPILLLTYPLCYRVFSFLRIAESKVIQILCRAIPLERMKPFFDSFQSCFRDECRYFSGLYFIYRLSALVSFACFQNLLVSYFLVEIQFVLMLAVHSWVQPYATRRHNQLDTFLFVTLITVNLLTIFRYSHTFSVISIETVHVIESIQIIIAYLPLLYMVVYVLGKAFKKIRPCCSCAKREVEEENEMIVSWSMLARNNSFTTDYSQQRN